MLDISQIKSGRKIVIDGEPYQVLYHEHSKTGRAGAVLRTKIKNLINGAVLEKTFQGADKAQEAEVSKSKAQFLYFEKDQCFFMDNTSYEQFSFAKEVLGNGVKFLKEGLEVDVLNFNSNPINIELPIKMTLEVTDAPPGIKGDTASGGNKVVTLETGATINAPLFIKTGDKIIINTEKNEYVSRV